MKYYKSIKKDGVEIRDFYAIKSGAKIMVTLRNEEGDIEVSKEVAFGDFFGVVVLSVEAIFLGKIAQSRGINSLNLRRWLPTPRGGARDGSIVEFSSAEEFAEKVSRWHKPFVAIARTREELDMECVRL